jgi:uncharacterized membrane protein
MPNQPISHQQLKAQLPVIKNSLAVANDQMSNLDKLALRVTDKIGSVGFFGIIFVWTVSWLLWNTLSPANLRFDPFPAFVLWLFLSNMIQIFLMPLLLIGQNLQSKHSEIRAQNDFEINTKAEQEIELILQHLEYQNELILKILEK